MVAAAGDEARGHRGDVVSLVAIVLTFAELSSRTGNPLGVVAFDRPGGTQYEANVSISEIVRVTIASAAWTSGQYNDALRPAAIALYLGPIVLIMLLAVRRRDPSAPLRAGSAGPAGGTPAFLAFAALGAFALAQTYNVIACVLARRGGNPIPIGGKEGWYWYVLAPIVIPALIAPALARWRWPRGGSWSGMSSSPRSRSFTTSQGRRRRRMARCSFAGVRCTPFTAHLGEIGVGPLAAWTTAIRLVHLTAFFSLESILQRLRRNDRNNDIARAD